MVMVGRDGEMIVWAGVAYADDGLWAAPTLAGLEVKLQGSVDFFSIIGPDMAMEKTHVCRFGVVDKGEAPVCLINRHNGTQKELIEVGAKQQFRHLGVFINAMGGGG